MEEDVVMVETNWPTARHRRQAAVEMRAASAMATAAALVSPGVSDVREREGATESKWEGRRTRPL